MQKAGKGFQITVEKFDGQKTTIVVTQDEQISSLKNKIQQKTHMRYFQQRLQYNNTDLKDQQTIHQLKLTKGSVIKLYSNNLKDIGVFAEHQGTPFRDLLLPGHAEPTSEDINQLVQALGGNQQAIFYVENVEVGEDAVKRLVGFADQKYVEMAQDADRNREDLQLSLSREQLVGIAGVQLVSKLQAMFADTYNEIIIRRCQAHDKMINFHTDVSLKTLQLSLNNGSDYKGGQLVYATSGRLHFPERKTGTITVHNNQIVHGVTELKSGVRYGLFLLKKNEKIE